MQRLTENKHPRQRCTFSHSASNALGLAQDVLSTVMNGRAASPYLRCMIRLPRTSQRTPIVATAEVRLRCYRKETVVKSRLEHSLTPLVSH